MNREQMLVDKRLCCPSQGQKTQGAHRSRYRQLVSRSVRLSRAASPQLGRECINRLVTGLSREAKKSKIAVVGLNPSSMRTERVLQYTTTEARKKQFCFDLSESPEYIEARLQLSPPTVIRKPGQLLWVSDLANEYGFTDVSGCYIPRFDASAPQQDFPELKRSPAVKNNP